MPRYRLLPTPAREAALLDHFAHAVHLELGRGRGGSAAQLLRRRAG